MMNLKDRLNQAYSGAHKKPPAEKESEGESRGKQNPSRPPAGPEKRQESKAPAGQEQAKQAPLAGKAVRTNTSEKSPGSQKSGPAEGLVKKTSDDHGYRKVAKFLLLLGQEEAARVMQHLKHEELEGIVREISTIKKIETVEAQAILDEFGGLVKSGALSPGGGSETAKDILVQAFGEKKGGELFKRALPESNKPFQYLSEFDANQILILLKDESAHVMAIVLPQLAPKLASEILIRLSPDQRMEVVRRMAKLDKISPDVMFSIDDGLRRKAEKVGKVDTESIDGAQALAGILRYLNPDKEEEILGALEESNPELSESIREKLFTLDDVVRVRPLDLQRELREISDKEIALTLKGKSDAFKDKILSCVSRERRKMILDEFDIIGSVRRQDVDTQTRDFLARLKRLYENGELILEEDDDLVY